MLPCAVAEAASGVKHIAIFAARDIAPGEELSYDYCVSGQRCAPYLHSAWGHSVA